MKVLVNSIHRSRASQAVNEQQLLTAWNVGAYVSNKLKTEQWGSKVVTQFAENMRVKSPEQKGFSRRNIHNMVMFYEEYSAPIFFSTIHSYLPNISVQLPTAQIQDLDIDTPSVGVEIAQAPTVQFVQSEIGQIRDVKRSNENPSIGIILCPEADKTVVEYAMSRSMSPTMVAEYKRQLIPKEKMQILLREYCDMASL